jgi:hypothetical protein
MDYMVLMMVVPYMSIKTFMCDFFFLPLFFFKIKLSITKDSTSVDLIFICSSVLYLSVNRFTKIYLFILYINLQLVLMITGRLY